MCMRIVAYTSINVLDDLAEAKVMGGYSTVIKYFMATDTSRNIQH